MKKTVSTDYLWLDYKVTPKACEVMRVVKEKLTEELYERIFNSLPGWEAELQVVISANISDAVCYGWERYTSIGHVDEMLKSFYLAIDKEFDRI